MLSIPLLNIILLMIWSFSGSVQVNLRNLARATLILMSISLVLSVVLYWLLWRGLSSISTEQMLQLLQNAGLV